MPDLMPDAAKTFREKVASLLKDRRITLAQFARDVKTPRPNLHRILAGTEGVTLERAERIATKLGMELSELIAPPAPPPETNGSKHPTKSRPAA